MTLSADGLALLWQLALSILAATAVALGATQGARRVPALAASPGFWWTALAIAVMPAALAHLLPDRSSALPEPWTWLDAAEPMTQPLLPAASEVLATLPALRDWILCGWLAGVIASIGLRLRGKLRLQALLKNCNALPAAALPGPRSRRLARALAAHNVQLRRIDAAYSPFAHQRSIVLPNALLARLDDVQCWLLLRHEATHLRMRDPFWHALLAVVVTLHWFNPGVRRLAERLRLAAELRCDARAIGRRKYMRRAYAEAYLETLRMSATRALPCPAAAFSPQNQGHHKMRIAHILSSPPRPGKQRAIALALLALGTGAAFTMAQAAGLSGTPVADGAAPDFRGPIIRGRVSSSFGVQRPTLSAEAHRGIDLTAARGTAVHAPADGIVLVAEAPFSEAPRYGSVVILDHGGGWRSLYAHLDRIDVAKGDRIRAGDIIGGLGSTGQATGPHVHVEVHHDGERVDPASLIASIAGA